ncbi:MAG: 3-methyl-2-oxobutanoate hydroxymethyltransferase [Caldisericaceae bacterium]
MEQKVTVPQLISFKGKKKIVSVTSYDYLFARIVDESGFDFILVGDSVGTTYQGLSSTIPVKLDEMLYHTRIVRRGVKRALLVGDMPFMSYQASEDEAVYNAGLFLKEGADAVKLEGGSNVAKLVERMVSVGIPVMGHIGLTPQSSNLFGGYKIQGKEKEEIKRLLESAKALTQAGAFSIVLEGMPEEVALEITQSIPIPTIGIGAGRYCDGQILVITDLLGLDPNFSPKFVKKYLDLHSEVKTALMQYAEDILNDRFPGEANVFHLRKDE